jgi:hypothetical protein
MRSTMSDSDCTWSVRALTLKSRAFCARVSLLMDARRRSSSSLIRVRGGSAGGWRASVMGERSWSGTSCLDGEGSLSAACANRNRGVSARGRQELVSAAGSRGRLWTTLRRHYGPLLGGRGSLHTKAHCTTCLSTLHFCELRSFQRNIRHFESIRLEENGSPPWLA